MLKFSTLCLLSAIGFSTCMAQDNEKVVQEPMYHLNLKVDIPVTAVTGGWAGYALSKIYGKEESSVAEIMALDKNKLNFFDRWAAGRHSENAANNSDYFFYGSMPIPLLLIAADRGPRKEGLKIGFMYLEAMSLTGVLYTSGTYFIDRYRPEAYSEDLAVGLRQNGNSRNSFFAGHVALVSTATFFTAGVYNDYHPHSNWKYVFYGGAIVATGTTAYLRYKAGKHFPTDIVLGTAVGTLSGLLVPYFHRNNKNNKLGISPMMGGMNGLTLTYKM